jgi:DegV family protein with EDD domain
MEATVRVVTDSSSDLPPHLLKEYQIEVVQLSVSFGTELYLDGELSKEAFWQKTREGPYLPQTSQPAVGAFEQVFEPLVAGGHQVLCVTVTGRHSGTYNSARVAAERFGGVITVFDSLSLSLGLGIQALEGAKAGRDGRAMQEIVPMLEDLRERVHLFILLDTLEYLRHGGRAATFLAVAERMTQALNIKLIVNFVDGRLRLMGPVRSYEGGLRRMLRMVGELGALEHLGVAHTRRHETAEEMADRLADQVGFAREDVWVLETGAVLGSHAGPGVMGVMAVPESLA